MSTKTLSSIQALFLHICYIRTWQCIDQDEFLRIHNVKVIVIAFTGKIVNYAHFSTVAVPYRGQVRKLILGPICMCSWGCAVHHLACTMQPRGHRGMEQVFTFTHGGVVESCASQNAKPDILKMVVFSSNILHQIQYGYIVWIVLFSSNTDSIMHGVQSFQTRWLLNFLSRHETGTNFTPWIASWKIKQLTSWQ